MEKYAWRAILKPGMKNEYKRRHDEIWPEMIEVLKKAGIRNYTIWLTGDELFGYYLLAARTLFNFARQYERDHRDEYRHSKKRNHSLRYVYPAENRNGKIYFRACNTYIHVFLSFPFYFLKSFLFVEPFLLYSKMHLVK